MDRWVGGWVGDGWAGGGWAGGGWTRGWVTGEAPDEGARSGRPPGRPHPVADAFQQLLCLLRGRHLPLALGLCLPSRLQVALGCQRHHLPLELLSDFLLQQQKLLFEDSAHPPLYLRGEVAAARQVPQEKGDAVFADLGSTSLELRVRPSQGCDLQPGQHKGQANSVT